METILFYIKRRKPLKNGSVPIYIRITSKGCAVELSSGLSTMPDHWIAPKGRLRGTTLANKQTNASLEQQEQTLRQIAFDLKNEGREASARQIANRFQGKDETHAFFLALYAEHNEQLKELIDKTVAEATYKRHCTSFRLFQRFLSTELNLSDILVREINKNLLTRYHHYLMTVRGTNNNSANKYVRNMAKILNWAVVQGIIPRSPSEGMRLKMNKVDKAFLSAEELQRVAEYDFGVDRLDQVRDTFVFCCYTGLAYTDVHSLTPQDITSDNQGRKWIHKRRGKTGAMCDIPLLTPALRLIGKYEQVGKVSKTTQKIFPVLSNQKMNAYLKEIAAICRVEKPLSTHSARHTFATTVTLANNVSIENVSKMLGHSTIQMTQHYARILSSTVARQMDEVEQKLRPESAP